MPDTVVLSEIIFHIALWVTNSRWPPFVQGQAINSYHFRHNRGRFVFLVSIMGFSGMPYIVVFSENNLDIASIYCSILYNCRPYSSLLAVPLSRTYPKTLL